MVIKKSYSEKLKDPRWQKKRLEIIQRDNWTCQFCLDTKSTLHIHHLIYMDEPWDVSDNCLITLCEDCHQEETENRKTVESDLLLILRQKKIRSEYIKLISTSFINCDIDLSDDSTIGILLKYIEKGLKKSVIRFKKQEEKYIQEFFK